MPVTIEKSVYIRDKEGHVTILTENDQIAENTDITMKCDSPKCAVRHNGKHVEISWNVEAVKADANALSDGFYRILSLVLDAGNQKPTQKTFCSPGCVRDFLQYEYVVPLSPREQALLMAQNQQAEIEKHRPAINVVPFKPQGPVDNEVVGPVAVGPTYQDPAKDYAVEPLPEYAPPLTLEDRQEHAAGQQEALNKVVTFPTPPESDYCIGEQPNCPHCCEHKTEELLTELPSDITPYDPDEVPFT